MEKQLWILAYAKIYATLLSSIFMNTSAIVLQILIYFSSAGLQKVGPVGAGTGRAVLLVKYDYFSISE